MNLAGFAFIAVVSLFATTGQAQSGLGNATFDNATLALIGIAQSGVDAVNHAADVLNSTNSQVPAILEEIKTIRMAFQEISTTVARVTNISYMVGAAAAVISVSAVIVTSVIFGRFMLNKNHCCGANGGV